jgi:hypothetical protein
MLARQLAEASLFDNSLVPRQALCSFFDHCITLETFFLRPQGEHHIFNSVATIESVVEVALAHGNGMSVDCAAMPEALHLDMPAAIAHRVNCGAEGV